MEETSVLIARSQAGERDAREVLIEKNLGLVHHIVKRFANRGYDLEDLFQIGTIGLMKAIDKFDLSLGLKFSTYAVPMITGEIKRFLRDDGMVKVSRTIKENGTKIGFARQKLQGILGREPTIQEIAGETGMDREDIVLAMEASIEVESIYSAVYQDDGSEVYLVDKVVRGSSSVGNSMVGIYSSEDSEKEELLDHMLLKQLLDGLEPAERELISMRYFQDKTQMEIASVLGISQVQVSRMEKKILLRMRERAKI
ncbi:MAG: SigB/SigF/SigG family RNA polymerase sigma factor [Eubacterium sp.]|nr:SigB/SigF/SigG family RNA polymerase sigma factor [Eubacterium sp.]MCM1217465.1 SigB/SigF/SigG family RNA polymerase sigma factor [Lachnospiraceae bacterium]MCM1302507.1 SigB/SigF/SigG family RNA polymerase sigma factor [Butyrivibrio sp.]MCM1344412.1 SigB/SigF/SigG family RNA polymerase sigma factor [Muribaculaceae bacterium]MCM1065512.1 SigB/SigF/SigG family RNA polymerase sigma factor [Eubacterium sp.]